MSTRPIVSALAALGLLALAGSAPPPPPAKTYSVAAIRKMAFERLHLGMTHQAACERLFVLGFIRRPGDKSGPGCGADWQPEDAPDADDPEAAYEFFFSPAGWKLGPVPGGPGSTLSKVDSFHLQLTRVGGVRIVTGITVSVNDPDKGAAMLAALIRQWGAPTVHQAWGHVSWAVSSEAADYNRQADFSTCVNDPVCKHHENGRDCVSILQRFADPHVRFGQHAFGYYIEFTDGTAHVDWMRRTGGLARIERDAPNTVCVKAPAMMM